MSKSYRVISDLSKHRKGVFLVQNINNSEYFVVKRRPFLLQVQNEYNALLACKGPCIQRVLGIDNNELLLEYYFDSRSLLSLSDSEEDYALLCMALSKTVEAIRWCHGKGYVHGDIKPSNILILPNNEIKLIDFGASLPIGTIYSNLDTYEYTPKNSRLNERTIATSSVDWDAMKFYVEMAIKKSPMKYMALLSEILSSLVD